MPELSDVQTALDAFARGSVVIVFDDADRENEGDFVVAGEFATAEAVNLMITSGRGLLCVAADNATLARLSIRRMVSVGTGARNTFGQGDTFSTAFMETMDLADPDRPGLSADDRAACIRRLASPDAVASDFRKPGHTFPLAARDGGLAVRTGHTEASVELCRLTGLVPVAAICEIMNPDGTMARLPQLARIARELGLPLISIAQLVEYQAHRDPQLRCLSRTSLPTSYGRFDAAAYGIQDGDAQYLVLTMGDVQGRRNVLARIHSACVTGDLFSSLRCDCGPQLHQALERIAAEGEGVLVYCLSHEGRGIGLAAKLDAYTLQDSGLDTVDANVRLGYHSDHRDYGAAISLLQQLDLHDVRLMTNNPAKVSAVGASSIGVGAVESITVAPTAENLRYLRTKRDRMRHTL